MADQSSKHKDAVARRRRKLGGKSKTARTREVRSLFGIVVEGETEKQYFQMGYFREPSVRVMVNPGKPNDPPSLARAAGDMIVNLKRDGTLRSGDQVWVVLDADNWSDSQLETVFGWAEERAARGDRGVGLCVPQFEYWLLLHFEDGAGVGTKTEVLDRLAKHIPDYEKNVPLHFSEEQIKAAVARARVKVPRQFMTLSDLDSMTGRGTASTTVHFLVDKLCQSLGQARTSA